MRDLKRSAGGSSITRWLKLRVTLVGAGFLVLLVVLLGRAFSLQVIERERLKELAQDQYVRQIEIPGRRGDIFDRRGVPLAQSVEVDSVWIDPSMLVDRRLAARQLAAALGLDAKDLTARLLRARRFAWVMRQARPEQVARVKALELPGVGFAKEPRRFYPQKELAAHVLGMVGTDGHGLEGIERAFDDELAGQSASLPGVRDARGRKLLLQGLAGAVERQGADLTLTIDRHIQYVAERALTKAVEASRAKSGVLVVLEPSTGDLLAIANTPPFNPNTPGAVSGDATRNRAVTDVFEPGSTLKSFLVAAALEQRVIRPDETFECEGGSWRVGGHTVNDTHPHGLLDPAGILRVSSNIGAGKIAQRLGREGLLDAYSSFGFGRRTGIALPSEGKGALPYPKAEISLVTQSFGQGMSASAVQIAAAYGALANGGVLMQANLVSKVVDPDGVVLLSRAPTPLRRAVSEDTARQVLEMLETVVTPEGTAPRARLDAYRVAGKTGTAQKVDPVAGGYSDLRIASFVGVVPAEAPRLVIVVIIDEPQTNVYGGVTAAPAFVEVATRALPYLGVSPSHRPPDRETVAGTSAASERPLVARNVETEGAAQRPLVLSAGGDGVVSVPDVHGAALRSAVAALVRASLEPQVEGVGNVVAQSPAAGTLVEKGAKVTLQLAGGLRP